MKKRKKLTFCSRPFTCSECHRSFTQQSSLATHKRTHSGEKPFSCTVCGREFANGGNMKIHMRVHTGERPFECMFCQRGFSQQNSLKAHLRIHSGEKPFSCDQCDKTFRVLGNLRKHQAVHSENVPYACEICEKKFKLKSDLKRHKKTFHELNVSSNDVDEFLATPHLLANNIQSSSTSIIDNQIKVEPGFDSGESVDLANKRDVVAFKEGLSTIDMEAVNSVTGIHSYT
ncbi:hypothetical protein HELRODRAFT_110122 [Helobdella robusta]|uniref:C2H2-type domain-containing protein n=1 Tax=Helobdella robusta TaxID=6412 RepID=T1EEZ4_HELRO|nr:hypothetical protein HELRODRAFT_110122 [Helobdella robusta]ESO08548.1 hypothetical protein HELRODRAFT_110122 [Helobdella robusta]